MNRRAFIAFLAGIQSALNGCKGRASVPVGPIAFGYKMSWIAVQSQSVQDVVQTLGLIRPKPANWQEGIDAAYGLKRAFVAPPVNGWVAIVGFGATDLNDLDPLSVPKARTEAASKHFRVSCGFSTHRVTEYHHWIRAEEGHLTRCFAYLGERGEILSNFGPVTPAERVLSFGNLPPEQWQPDESDVMRIAAAWSYDPSKLTASSGSATLGAIADWKV